VAAMDEHRLGRQPVADRSAGTATFAFGAHEPDSTVGTWQPKNRRVFSELR
jgi:hypothetical protein